MQPLSNVEWEFHYGFLASGQSGSAPLAAVWTPPTAGPIEKAVSCLIDGSPSVTQTPATGLAFYV